MVVKQETAARRGDGVVVTVAREMRDGCLGEVSEHLGAGGQAFGIGGCFADRRFDEDRRAR